MDLKLWIRKSDNGVYLVDKEVKEGNLLSRPEVKTYSFTSMMELSRWIERGGM